MRSFLKRLVVIFALAAAITLLLTLLGFYPKNILPGTLLDPHQPLSFPPPLPIDDADHPIDYLVRTADLHHEYVVRSESHSIADAARAYRKQRRRHPPPGFELWYAFAKKHNVSVIEAFFDQIYEDLEPYWSMPPQQLREFPNLWPKVLSVRNGIVNVRSPVSSLWMFAWQDMLRNMPQLPDVDLPMKDGDEPRVMIPFSAMKEHMKAAEQSRQEHHKIPPEEMKQGFWEYPPMTSEVPGEGPAAGMVHFGDREFWDYIVDSCRPDDPVNQFPDSVPKHATPPVLSTTYTAGSFKGYVLNATTARNVCHNPNLRTLHGFLIEPFMKDIYTVLMPMFAVTKLVGVGNDILIPPPTHWASSGTYAGADHTSPWKTKKNGAVWRGDATGGFHTASNWWGFHRHRMMHVMNGTLQAVVEEELRASGLGNPSMQALQAARPDTFDWGMHNFPFPLRHLYGLAAQSYGKLGRWVSSLCDGGFTCLHCSELSHFLGQKTCGHTDPYYSVVEWMNVSDVMSYKYLPDIDGHTSSGRFLGFLRSLSVPIKSSIFAEWHDRRLTPWRHYVPMSGEYQEWWGLLQYFLGYKGSEGETSVPGHDKIGEKIGRQGYEWSHHVERRENLLVYFYRIIIEYARICADNRIELGYVEDLLKEFEDGK